MSLVLERRTSKEEILELYLNDVYLGQRGSFAIHGVAEASRIFFGKDVANLGLSEAALIAGVIQSPASRSPFANPKRAVERRNVVLQAMAGEKYITEDEADDGASREPLQVVARSVDNEAPYFVDMVAARRQQAVPRRDGATRRGGRLHHARSQPAARRARRRSQRARQRRQAARAAQAQAGDRAGRAAGRRSAHRRDSRHGRRPFVQPVAVQPHDRGAPTARLGLQAVRLPRRLRARRR